MVAFCPPMFQGYGWSLEDPIINEQSYIFGESETAESFPYLSPILSDQPQLIKFNHSATSFTGYGGEPDTVKKLNHNASERDRRRKINNLYSSLRSLLPPDQTKKLSIPATVSRVLKYIPELQQQVEKLVQKKQELLKTKSKQDDMIINQANQRTRTHQRFSIAVSVNRVNNTEFIIQISTSKIHQTPLSQILLSLHEEGLFLMNSSSFKSSNDRVFHNLHLQVKGTVNIECEALRQKLLSLYEERESMFP
ncbi:hypothetical protein K2173_014935 [Erythroxylum novogranatense]|uniref:BHLH domain-containing protein n=1 Tax=Erythroxylum novogranatense TaxID=1862640 RepID=A0AAV8TWT8_9ROSI|nr:hypothetical protein K2173_014935 [Erythroxylum novogranatense]